MTATPAIVVQGRPGQPLGMSPTRFLDQYWQKRPLLVRQAFANFRSPISAEELAGLACEEGVLARLIVHDAEREHWQVETGPFQEERFASLPEEDWTLLVQDVDKWDPDVATILEHFDFLPGWRLDDVMVSFAAPDGSVGAHIDQYDVFLLQASGHRYWMIDDRPDAPTAFRPDQELRLLAQFQPNHEWLLEPGDLLYLPPGVPHHGTAAGESRCLTWSVGLRAPSVAELAVDFIEHLSTNLPDSWRYADPDLKPAREPGRIDASALARVRDLLQQALTVDEAAVPEWFGSFITGYRVAGMARPRTRPMTPAAFAKRLAGGGALHRHPLSRFAWYRQRGQTRLFVAGDGHDASPDLCRRLCQAQPLPISQARELPPAGIELLRTLVNQGHLVIGR